MVFKAISKALQGHSILYALERLITIDYQLTITANKLKLTSVDCIMNSSAHSLVYCSLHVVYFIRHIVAIHARKSLLLV